MMEHRTKLSKIKCTSILKKLEKNWQKSKKIAKSWTEKKNTY